MCKLAFLYPGQGAQKAGMGADFYANSPIARKLFDEAQAALDFDLQKICFEENDQLDMTEYTQPAMVTTCLAMTRVLMERGIKPDVTAGLSLGEYAAIAAAQVMTDLDAIRLVRKRGLLMQNAVPAGQGAMCAVLGMPAEEIERLMADMEDVSVANYNCPGQTVITGKTDGVEAAAQKLKDAGAKRTVLLNVSGPFHSPFMKPAGEQLKLEVEKIAMQEPQIPYVSNVTAQKVEQKEQIAQLLSRGVYSSVRWQQSVECMIADGVQTFIEIGPGRTLSGFMKKINTQVNMYQVSTWEDIEKVAGELC